MRALHTPLLSSRAPHVTAAHRRPAFSLTLCLPCVRVLCGSCDACCRGDDVVLDDPELQINIPAIAVTYLWVYTINGEKLNNLIRNFPRTARRLGPVKRRLRCRRAIVRAAERRCYQMGVPFRGRRSTRSRCATGTRSSVLSRRRRPPRPPIRAPSRRSSSRPRVICQVAPSRAGGAASHAPSLRMRCAKCASPRKTSA
jgi:hypothetical protein